ncbi:hypothetical protein GIB67_032690, partial [Kingdonia uniflora]
GWRKLLRRRRRREYAQDVEYLATTTNGPAHFLRRRYSKQVSITLILCITPHILLD